MATFLDITALEHFSTFFVFIFVWLFVYAVFSYTKAFGQNKAAGIIIGLIIGLFVVFSPVSTGLVRYMTPWFALIFIFVILINVTIRLFGVGGWEAFGSLKWITLIIIVIAILIGSIGYVGSELKSGDGTDKETEETDYTKTANVFLHPKFLGMLFVLLVSIFTVALLAGRTQ